jgi:Tfp pilus assembly protein PilV
MRAPSATAPRRQRGTTLLEALVAFLVLTLGMLTVARVQGHLRLSADIARQRSEAVRLAQEDLETLRAFASIAATAGLRAYDDIANLSRTVDADTGYATNTHYRVTRRIEPAAAPHAKNASVLVTWTDRSGGPQQIALDSIIAGSDPTYSGALTLARSGTPVKGALGRSVRVPIGAKDLGDGRSAYKPASAGTIAYLFDNASGALSGRCTGIASTTPTRDLAPADLGSCDARIGYLLSGSVRYSAASPPDPQGHDLPLAAAVSLALAGGPYPGAPECTSEALKTVAYSSAGSLRLDAVPIADGPQTLGLASWAETGDRYLAYHCAVYPAADGRWSGRATLAPAGWSIGTSATDHRVCRYTSDLDASGAADTNLEHPAAYSAVDSALANQDFLVIAGSETCPGGAPAQIAGAAGDVYVDRGTQQLQP